MEIKTDIIKIAGEEAVSQTIEKLLELNNLLTERSNTYVDVLQEQQLSNTDNRWEVKSLTEDQFEEKRNEGIKKKVVHELDKWKDDQGITEIRLNKKENKQRREEAYEDSEIRGHKFVSPLWNYVYKHEDKTKKLDKKQLEKKK